MTRERKAVPRRRVSGREETLLSFFLEAQARHERGSLRLVKKEKVSPEAKHGKVPPRKAKKRLL